MNFRRKRNLTLQLAVVGALLTVTCASAAGAQVASVTKAASASAVAVRVDQQSPPHDPNVIVPGPGTERSSQSLIKTTGVLGHASDGSGNFRIVCRYSHMSYDDPIVYPGQPGKAHLHTFFGNTGTNANSTYDSLRTTGDGTCDGGIINRSAYWIPSLMNAAGQPVIPKWAFQYYKSGYRSVAPSSIQYMPNGLRMLAGNSKATAAQSSEIVNWYCASDPTATPSTSSASIPACPAGSWLLLSVTFPQCWDGVNLDSPDHMSHMAYPTYGKGCPADHPVGIPVLTLHAQWLVPAGGVSGYRVSSDTYPVGQPGGYSVHADFMEAWDPVIRNTFTDRCIRANLDCEVRPIGDGRELVEVAPF